MKPAVFAAALGLSFCLAPMSQAHHGGECYISKNDSHLCVVRTGDQQFSAAITNGTSVRPTVLVFHCTDGWRGAGSLSKEAMTLVVSAICSDHGQQKSPTTSVAGLM